MPDETPREVLLTGLLAPLRRKALSEMLSAAGYTLATRPSPRLRLLVLGAGSPAPFLLREARAAAETLQEIEEECGEEEECRRAQRRGRERAAGLGVTS